VSVFDAAAQYFEYINCHPKTGVLRADRESAGPLSFEIAAGTFFGMRPLICRPVRPDSPVTASRTDKKNQ